MGGTIDGWGGAFLGIAAGIVAAHLDMDWWLVVVVGVLVALGSVMVTLGPKQRSSSN